MKIIIGCDHGGFELKEEIKAHLIKRGFEVDDLGIHKNQRVNYPDYGIAVGEKVVATGNPGIVICGTGVGISIAANKVKGVRAACVSEPYSAKLSKMHNNANVLAMGGRVVGPELAKMIVDEWLDAEFEGDRHIERLGIISDYEEKHSK